MAKRFIDTKIWDKSWFRKLDPKDKLIWIYILTKCDHAGIFDADWEAMAFFIKGIGSRNGFQDLPETIKEKMTLVKDDQYFIPSFIEYQYGTLRENSKPHLSVLKRLRDKGLLEGLPKGLVALKDKDKDKVQVKDIDKRKEGFEKEVIEIAKTKKYDIKEVEKQFKDLQIGREHKNLNIPPHFMGKTEIIKEDVTDEIVIQRMEDIKIPTKTTLEDF